MHGRLTNLVLAAKVRISITELGEIYSEETRGKLCHARTFYTDIL
jgi:hypothetical protein